MAEVCVDEIIIYRSNALLKPHLGVRHQRGQTSVKLGKFHTEA